MKITKYTHACVRLQDGDRVLVIDPGVWSEAEALEGAGAVLITHEHADHVDVSKLTGFTGPIYAPENARIEGLELTRVTVGDRFDAAGFPVTVVGGRHALIYNDMPDCANTGFLVDGVYHPGDSVFVPEQPVETLLVPAHAPWLKLSEALDFANAIRPARTFPIHDALLNERGVGSVEAWFERAANHGFQYLRPGESTPVM